MSKPQAAPTESPSNPSRRKFFEWITANALMLGIADTVIGNPALEKALQEVGLGSDGGHAAPPDAAQHAEGSEHGVDKWDVYGTMLFTHGVASLMPKQIGKLRMPGTPAGRITWAHYLVLSYLLHEKHQAATESEKHHLLEEVKAAFKALAVIGGTIVGAEGITLNANLFEQQGISSLSDKIAATCMLGSCISPLATTVGSAAMLRETTKELARKSDGSLDHAMVNYAVSHISNLSGFILFGDPPFIAMAEKYGFREAVGKQLVMMFPLWFGSTIRTMYRMNRRRLELDNEAGKFSPKLSQAEIGSRAKTATTQGTQKCLPIVAKIMLQSARNSWKAFGRGKPVDDQLMDGIRMDIGKALGNKFDNIAAWLRDKDIPHTHKGEHDEGMTQDDEGSTQQHLESLFAVLEQRGSGAETLRQMNHTELEQHLDTLLSNRQITAEERGLYQIIANQLRPGESPQNPDHAAEQLGVRIMNSPSLIVSLFETEKLKTVFGHNLADVLNVFPFQALCVPFLVKPFQGVLDGIGRLVQSKTLEQGKDLEPSKIEDIALFLMVMGFSSFADNYVACKIGLTLRPERPEIALIASIIGGSLSSIGNMANLAQFNLDDFPMAESLKNYIDRQTLTEVVLAGGLYAEVIDLMRRSMGWPKFQPIASNVPVPPGSPRTRRSMFAILGPDSAQGTSGSPARRNPASGKGGRRVGRRDWWRGNGKRHEA